MGHLHGDGLAGGFLPVGNESLIELHIELAGGVVADIDQGAILTMGGNREAQRQRRRQGDEGKYLRCVLHLCLP
ncbi:hypothetical protein D3C72_2352990 [compost metagenome]